VRTPFAADATPPAAGPRPLLRALILLLALGVLVLAGAWRASSAQEDARSAARDGFEVRQDTTVGFVEEYVADLLRKHTVLAGRSLQGPVGELDLAGETARNGWQSALLLDSDGTLMAAYPRVDQKLGTKVLAGVPAIDTALSGTPSVSGVVPSVAERKPMLGFAVPFDTPSGRRVLATGFPLADTPLAPFVHHAVARTRLVYLIDDAGRIVASNSSNASNSPGENLLADVNPGVAALVAERRAGHTDVGGAETYVTSSPVAGTPWRLVLAAPTSDLYRALNGPDRWLPIAGLGAFAAAALVALALFLRTSTQAQRLSAGKARLRGVLNTAGDAFVAVDDRGRITDWNAAATALLGWTADEVLGRSMAEVIVPTRDHEALQGFLDPTADLGGVIERSVVHRDGREVAVELTLGRMQWAGGWRTHAFLRDTTERRAAERALAASEALHRLLAENSRDVISRLAPDGTYNYLSPAIRRLLGVDPDEMVGSPVFDLVHPDDVAGIDVALLQLTAGGDGDEHTFRMRHAAGHWVWVESVTSVVHAPDGTVAEIQASTRDITERMVTAEELHRQALVFNSIHDAVLIMGNDGVVLDCNQAALSLVGRAKSELVGKRAGALWGRTSLAARVLDIRRHLAEEDVWSGDLPFRRPDGSAGIAETTAVAVRDAAGNATGTITVSRDVTQVRRDEEALREGEERFRLAFDRAPIGMAMSSLQPESYGTFRRVNDALCAMLGYSTEDLLQHTFVDLTHPDDRAGDIDKIARWLAQDEDSVTFEKRFVHADGHVVHALLNSGVVRAADGAPLHSVTQVIDISERRAEAERLAALALQDSLTGLANRTLFTDRLTHALNRAQRHQRPLSVLFCDLDRFKAVNDTYGHASGDDLLVEVARRIRRTVRPSDTVARLGGDEFVIVCEDLTDDTGEAIAERVRTALEEPFRLSVGQVRIGVSIGVATVTPADATATGLTAEELLAMADKRMYADKRDVAETVEADETEEPTRVAPALSGLAGNQVDRIMLLARRHLGMDVVHISEFVDGQQVHRAADGDPDSFGLTVGSSRRREESYCHQMVTGALPNVVPDSSADSRVSDLPSTIEGRIGAYIGVPLRLSDGSLYGTLCCVSHRTRPDLDSRDVRFMEMLAELLVQDLDEQHQRQRQREVMADIIDAERVTIALQPVVDLRTGRCIGVEALSRFPAVAGSPETVFAAAREAGLALEMQLMVARRALAVLPDVGPGQRLGVNLSPDIALELADNPDFDGVPLDGLVLELTEHEAVESYAHLRERLEPLRKRGLMLAIDDAGAGYASLQHIVELRPDVIKIDRSLIHGLAADAARRSVVTSFVLVGLELGAQVVAEGVETSEDLAAAADLGVDAVQGYLIARPSTDPRDHAYWASDPDMFASPPEGPDGLS
jgi:diguanylate cyclase (GGDEF)-like protein/PAS domain S-box-containing protein